MKATWLLILLYACSLCSCAESRQVYLILDVARLDIPQVKIERQSEGEIDKIRFTPRGQVVITAVTYKRQKLWIGKPGEALSFATSYSRDGHLPLLFLRTKYNNISSNHHFIQRNDVWKPITNEEFKEKRKRMKNGMSTDYVPAASIAIPLDLTALDLEHVIISKGTMDGVVYATYSADTGVSFSNLVLETGEIWFGDAGQECVKVHIYFKKELPALASLQINYCGQPETEYFTQSSGSWLKVTSEDFNDKLNDLKNVSVMAQKNSTAGAKKVQKTLNPVKLNVQKPKTVTGMRMREEKGGTIDITFFSLEKAYSFEAISDGRSKIWKPGPDKECQNVMLFSKDGHPSILALSYETFEEFTAAYFKKANGKWTKINRKCFKKRIDELRCGKSPTKSLRRDHRKIVKAESSPCTDTMSTTVEQQYITVDIDTPPTDSCSIAVPSAKSPYLVIYPLGGTKIVKLVQGALEIWEGGVDECCLSASFLFEEGDPTLAHITVSNGSKLSTLYFKRMDTWVQIDEYDPDVFPATEETPVSYKRNSFLANQITLLILTVIYAVLF